jgi:MFS family permease
MAVADIVAVPLTDAEHRTQLRRAVIASTVGTTIEWYDFLLYGQMAAIVFAKLYFPGSDPLTGTLQAFAVFAVGFVARPIGAAIFGHYGDRIGRKAALIATLLLTGLSTFLVGCVPTYEQIGIWGPLVMVILRFIQGIGVGGEWGGSVLLSMEWAARAKTMGSSRPGRNSADRPAFSSPTSRSWRSANCRATSS